MKAIEKADLGLNPMSDGQTIRIMVPTPSAERRKQHSRGGHRDSKRSMNAHLSLRPS